MQFDVVIGNPPYQEMTGGGGSTEAASPIYQRFIQKAIRMKSKYISMILPSRWVAGGTAVLDTFRAQMINSQHLSKIYSFKQDDAIFNTVKIRGGVQYILYDSTKTSSLCEIHNCEINESGEIEYDTSVRSISEHLYLTSARKENYLIILDNRAEKIVRKLNAYNEDRLSSAVHSRRPFSLDANFIDSEEQTEVKNVLVKCSFGRITWTDRDSIHSNAELLYTYKVCVSKAIGDWENTIGDKVIITKPFIITPNQVCSESYLVVGSFNTTEEAESCMSYLKTRFARYLLSLTLSGMNITSRNFLFIPTQEYNKTWTDEELFIKYNLTETEISTIKQCIRIMD